MEKEETYDPIENSLINKVESCKEEENFVVLNSDYSEEEFLSGDRKEKKTKKEINKENSDE